MRQSGNPNSLSSTKIERLSSPLPSSPLPSSPLPSSPLPSSSPLPPLPPPVESPPPDPPSEDEQATAWAQQLATWQEAYHQIMDRFYQGYEGEPKPELWRELTDYLVNEQGWKLEETESEEPLEDPLEHPPAGGPYGAIPEETSAIDQAINELDDLIEELTIDSQSQELNLVDQLIEEMERNNAPPTHYAPAPARSTPTRPLPKPPTRPLPKPPARSLPEPPVKPVHEFHWQFYARSASQTEIGGLLNIQARDEEKSDTLIWILVPNRIVSSRYRQQLLTLPPETLLYVEGNNFDDDSYVIMADTIVIIPEAPEGTFTSYLRSDATQAKLRLQSKIRFFLQEFFEKRRFISMQTPPGRSKQIHGQMLVNGYFQRVYEFEQNMNKNHQLHLEMDIEDNYEQVFDLLSELFQHVQHRLYQTSSWLIKEAKETLNQSHPTVLRHPLPRVTYTEACQWLGRPDFFEGEFSPQELQWLAQIVCKSFSSDLFVIEQFPRSLRPYFLDIVPGNGDLTLSFDVIYRGHKIGAGGQRINDVSELEDNLDSYQQYIPNYGEYLETFQWGPPTQAGLQLNLGDLWGAFW